MLFKKNVKDRIYLPTIIEHLVMTVMSMLMSFISLWFVWIFVNISGSENIFGQILIRFEDSKILKIMLAIFISCYLSNLVCIFKISMILKYTEKKHKNLFYLSIFFSILFGSFFLGTISSYYALKLHKVDLNILSKKITRQFKRNF